MLITLSAVRGSVNGPIGQSVIHVRSIDGHSDEYFKMNCFLGFTVLLNAILGRARKN